MVGKMLKLAWNWKTYPIKCTEKCMSCCVDVEESDDANGVVDIEIGTGTDFGSCEKKVEFMDW